ncbi:MAG TPA: selenocysteine-specific translation elongation factor [Trebonia sp.]
MKVIATAGHVDHGKSTLVRALTGMEPDRWAEERRRGMTIDLGYAWTTLPAGGDGPAREETVAFVDVPGHERFVPNMLAGLGPVPAVLFVVAADGGWMPQSAEHLAAVDALGVRHGLLVVTRADLADPGPASRQALARIAKTSLGQVEAVAVSAVSGMGMDEARAALARLARSVPDARPEGPVRLWIDRSFTIRGSGTVVTGTLPSGTVAVGDELVLTPAGPPVRVRGIQALGESAEKVTGVARAALNLRGVPPDVPQRGMALVSPGGWMLSGEADVAIVPSAAGLPEKFPPALHLHAGSARVPVKLRVLGSEGAVYARLTLREPVPLHTGDRVLLRDPGAAELAIYGATVLDPFPAPLGRRGAAAAAARELASWPDPPKAADLLRRHGLLRAPSLTAAGIDDLPAPVAGDWLADQGHWENLRRQLPAVVAEFTAKNPLAQGMPVDAARAALDLPARDLVTALLGEDRITLEGGYLRTATGSLPPKVAGAVTALREDLAGDPFAAPDAERLRELRLDSKALAAAARAGLLLRISDQVVLAPGADDEAARRLAELPQPFTTSQARRALGTSRRVAIPLLEYLDRARVTERLPDDTRRLR